MNKSGLDSKSISLLSTLVQAKEAMDRVPTKAGQYSRNIVNVLDDYVRLSEAIEQKSALYRAIAHCYLSLESAAKTDEERSGYYKQTVVWAKKAVKADPNNASLHAFLGYVYWIAELDYEESAAEFRKAFDLGSSDDSAYVIASKIHYRSPDSQVSTGEITGWLEKANRIAPNNADHHAFLAEVYYENSRIEDSLREWILALLSTSPLQQGYIQTVKSVAGNSM